jgi:hypothetical protein
MTGYSEIHVPSWAFTFPLHALTRRTVKGKIVLVLNLVKNLSTMPWRRKGRWKFLSNFLDHGLRWTWVVSFTTLPFYPRGKCPQYPLNRRLGGPHCRCGRCAEEKNLAQSGIDPDWPALSPSLHWLCYPGSNWTVVEIQMDITCEADVNVRMNSSNKNC